MKDTPLVKKHQALGAKMTEFAGYNMPLSYEGVKAEHLCVRNNVGVFDVSHMGEFIIRGKEALELIQKVTTNDASKLTIGKAQYSALPNDTGGLLDDLLVYRLPEDMCAEGEKAYMLVVNASNIEKDWNWIKEQNTFDTKMINISEQTGLLAVQGPNATKVLQKLTDVDLSTVGFYTFVKGQMAGLDNVLISATGYTGAGGFELYADSSKMEQLWDAIFEAGKDLDIKPIGLGARDTLRMEMGFCLYGNDIDETTSTIEAGLGWITKFKKGDFNSRDIFLKQKTEGIDRKLVGFTLNERRVPRHGYKIENENGEVIGEVTSGTQSPSLNHPIGMGYVPKSYAEIGRTIYVVAGKKRLMAEIVKPPFIKKA
ncbi:MAG: glycine cleavage system aminomethyltransferase GcvT [Saprospiraceae bacterium]|nr:glycine cleavage system aminomethyltransferase GcvT [Saprospiraceae bacterium]